MEKLLYKEESYNLIGVLFDVHNHLGGGFLEVVYSDAVEYELQQRQILLKEKRSIKFITKTQSYHIIFTPIL